MSSDAGAGGGRGAARTDSRNGSRRRSTRATTWFIDQQDARGYWYAPLEANATMEAEYVFFNRMLGRQKPEHRPAAWPSACSRLQRADGSWPLWPGGPGAPLDHDRGVLRAEARRVSRPTSRRSPAPATSSSPAGDWRRRASSPASGSRASGSTRRRASRSCRSSWRCCRRGSRSTSTRCRAGRAGPSSRSSLMMAQPAAVPRAARGGRAPSCGSVRRRRPTSRSRARPSWSRGGTSSWRSTRRCASCRPQPVEAVAAARRRAGDRVDPPPSGHERAVGRHPAGDAQLGARAARRRLRATTIR